MNTIKLTKIDNAQIISLPENYQLQGDEVYIKKVGNTIVLIPINQPWETLFNSLGLFSADFMQERDQPVQNDRETPFE